MKDQDLKTKNVGKLVAEDYHTATVFKKYGIDFYCKGGKTIEEAYKNKNISEDKLLADLETISKKI